MKKIYVRYLILICGLFVSTTSFSVNTSHSPAANHSIELTRSILEQRLGRPLTLKEKIAFPLVKRKWNQIQNKPVDEIERGINGMALAGFIMSVVGLFAFGVILGLLGLIFSGIGITQIDKYPEKFKGSGFAIAGIVLGIVAILGAFVVISLFN